MPMWEYYKKSAPVKVKGGIRAQTTRGGFGANWWAKRWIAALESFQDSGRLSRGRSYARSGQVLSIDIEEGCVRAKVQGSRPAPYKVMIQVDILPVHAWQEIARLLTSQALFAAKLLSGEMPQDIESIFDQSNIPLLPNSHQQLKTDCSCPDWSNPCKHVAAVYYLLGEEFDRDPFLIFKMRGISREAFLDMLGKHSLKGIKPQPKAIPPSASQPLPCDALAFWQGTEVAPDVLQLDFTIPKNAAILPKSLGKFPFWRGETPLQETLEAIYARASQQALSAI